MPGMLLSSDSRSSIIKPLDLVQKILNLDCVIFHHSHQSLAKKSMTNNFTVTIIQSQSHIHNSVCVGLLKRPNAAGSLISAYT